MTKCAAWLYLETAKQSEAMFVPAVKISSKLGEKVCRQLKAFTREAHQYISALLTNAAC